MNKETGLFRRVLQDSLTFEYLAGQAGVLTTYRTTTGWRQLPFMVVVHVLKGGAIAAGADGPGHLGGSEEGGVSRPLSFQPVISLVLRLEPIRLSA